MKKKNYWVCFTKLQQMALGYPDHVEVMAVSEEAAIEFANMLMKMARMKENKPEAAL